MIVGPDDLAFEPQFLDQRERFRLCAEMKLSGPLSKVQPSQDAV